MLNIIKSDIYRIFRGKAIYVAILSIILFTTINVISMQAGSFGINLGDEMTQSDVELIEALSQTKTIGEYRKIMKDKGSFALDKEVLKKSINFYYLFIVIVVIVACTDFSNKSIKNTLSSAITRKRYYIAKLLLITILTTVMIFFYNSFTYVLNYYVNGSSFTSNFKDIILITLKQLPLLYGIMSMLVCFSFLFRKTSTFNTITIPFLMIIQLICTTIIHLFKLKANWFNYEVQTALSKLVTSTSPTFLRNCIILGIAYIIIFNIIGYMSFKKAEIK